MSHAPPYGRDDTHAGEPLPTYFDLPAMKKSHYNWMISSYFFVGGIASAAHVLATVADLVDNPRDRKLVASGRYLAPAGALIGTGFLIADLQRPSRWYNMLRIFRITSPMSIGAWTLVLFGTLSGLTATAQAAHDALRLPGARLLARIFGLAALVPAMVVSFYTAVLLSYTATPLWSVAYRRLPALFASSAMASACSALLLVLHVLRAPVGTIRALQLISLPSLLAQFALTKATEERWKHFEVEAPVEQPRRKLINRYVVKGAGMLFPLAAHALSLRMRRRRGWLVALAAIGSLIGTYAERWLIIYAGNESAQRPRDYFRLTQPDASKELSGQ